MASPCFLFIWFFLNQWPLLPTFTLTLKENGGNDRSCTCLSVETWLDSKITNGDEVVSFRVVTDRRLRVSLRDGCRLASNNNSQLWRKLHSKQRDFEILVSEKADCMAFQTICDGDKIHCFGLSLISTVGHHSLQRRLLMVPEGIDHHVTYGVLLPGVLLCVVVIILALCVKSSKEEPSIADAENGNIKVISSGKIETIPQSSSVTEIQTKNTEASASDITIEPGETAKDLAPIQQEASASAGITSDEIDGQVLTKEKASEKKSRKKPKRTEEKPRANTENAKSIKKGRFSLNLKSKSLPSSDKRSKSVEDVTEPSPGREGDRRSFADRRLPQLPQACAEMDDNYAEPYDTKPRKETVVAADIEEEEEDDNYETVVNHTREHRIISAKEEVRRSTMSSTSPPPGVDEAPEQDVFSSGGDYEVVDRTRSRAGEIDDAYEEVVSKPSNECSQYEKVLEKSEELYEDVNSSGVYEQPDIVTPDPKVSQRKTKSLPLGKTHGPTPPPLENLRNAVRHLSHEEEEDKKIDPYTVTTKKGDYIIQETSLPTLPLSTRDSPVKPGEKLTPEQFDALYAKVDKEKQKKDRLERKEREEEEKKGDVEEVASERTDNAKEREEEGKKRDVEEVTSERTDNAKEREEEGKKRDVEEVTSEKTDNAETKENGSVDTNGEQKHETSTNEEKKPSETNTIP